MPFASYVMPFYFETGTDADLERHVTVIVRMAFGDDMFDETPNWTTLTGTDILEVHTKRGRQHALARTEAGTCVLVLDNASGDYYPDNAGGAYFPDIKTMVRVNIRAYWQTAGAVWDVFNGYVESWTPSWLGKSATGPVVKIVIADAMKVFSRLLMTNAGEVLEQSGTRVGNIADEVGWPAAWRDIETGKEVFLATGVQTNVNALDRLYSAQDSELSLVYIAPDNDLQFEERGHRVVAPHDEAQAKFGNGGEGDGEDRFEEVVFVLDEALLYNDIRFTRTGGSQQVYTGAASQTAYGVRSLARGGLDNSTDVAVDILAEYVGKRYQDAASRVKSIMFRPGEKFPCNQWAKALLLGISDRINIVLDQASIDKDYYIEGVAHDWFAKSRRFTTRWQLSDALQDYPAMAARTQDISPDGAGDETNINGAATGDPHWMQVVDGGTGSYVENNDNATSFDRDLYEMETPAYESGTIQKVEITVHCFQEAWTLTPGKIKIAIKSGGTVAEGAEAQPDFATYSVHTFEWANNPDTAAAWTFADLQSIQGGIAIKAPNMLGPAPGWLRCKYLSLKVYYTPTWA